MLYQHGLAQAQSVMEQSVKAATLKRRHTLGSELSTCLLRLHATYPRDLQGVRPEELLCFLQTHWVLNHAGSLLPGSTTKVASPGCVDGAIRHLPSLFESLGRCGPYVDATGADNPCSSSPIKDYRRGYHQMLWAAGYQESSAVPMTQSKVEAVATHLTQAALQAPDSLTMIVHLRDALVILHSWATAYRGIKSGMLCLLNLHTPERVPIFPNGYDPAIPLPSTFTVAEAEAEAAEGAGADADADPDAGAEVAEGADGDSAVDDADANASVAWSDAEAEGAGADARTNTDANVDSDSEAEAEAKAESADAEPEGAGADARADTAADADAADAKKWRWPDHIRIDLILLLS
eukprot:gene25854-biopygen20342